MTRPQEAIEEKIEQRLDDLLEQRLQELDEEPLRWLALLPEWTQPLAEACRFPQGKEDLEQLVTRAEALGFCEVQRERDIAGEETLRFWMPHEIRTRLFDRWPIEPNLNMEIEEIATRILEAGEQDLAEVSAGTRRWAELASAELTASPVTGKALTSEVSRSLSEEDPGAAGRWILAAEELRRPFGAEMEAAGARAQRQLNFYHRRAQDARYLRHFIEREEQLVELRGLVGSDKQWALHFIGLSGVGKTMLMRYLTSRSYASSPIACSARIDFDHIDPRYPLESPARLLHELGEGLAADLDDSAQEALFRSFREAVTEAEAVRLDPAQGPLQALETPEFEEVVATFATFVNSLPQPVVLILDTCEELAKLHPAGEDVPSISATFEILERVHADAGGVKVIFAGRRWLTPEAANMKREKRDATPRSVVCVAKRPYMNMHEIRGFTEAQVVEYLTLVCGKSPAPAMLRAVLEVTHDLGRVAGTGEPKPGEAPRYNPNDVSLLGSWLAEDPELAPETLAGGNLDPFVEARIFGRLESPEVMAAIPAAVLLQRFDAALIEPALGKDRATRDRALNGLIDQEWTHLDGGPDPKDIVIKIDGGLRVRLQNYYEHTSTRERVIDDARGLLTPHLAELIEQAPSGVTVDAIDAAMRLLPEEEAARRFDRMSERVAAASEWSWAEAVCGRLLSPERDPPLAGSLAPSVGALYVAALKHRKSSANLRPLWETVERESGRHPDPGQARALCARGGLGALAAAAANGGFSEDRAIEVLSRGNKLLGDADAAPSVAPGLLAAIEALVDAREVRGYSVPATISAGCLEGLFDHFSGDELVQAQILALRGRIALAGGDWQAAGAFFEQIERMPLEESAGGQFIDWVPPDSIRHRVLLELLRFRLARQEDRQSLIAWCERTALERIAGPDAAQLLSLAIQARLANGELDRDQLDLVRRHESAVKSYDLTSPAHRVAPPLFVSVAEAWLAIGAAAPALDLLAEREHLATSRRTDEDATRAAALATVRILRRLRLRDRLALIGSFSSDEDEELRAEALAAGALIAGLQPPPGRASDRDHAAWRARILLDASGDEVSLNLAARWPWPRLATASLTAMHAALDRIEAGLVRQRAGGRSTGLRLDRGFLERSWGQLKPAISDPLGGEEVRLQLRLNALIGGAGEPGSSIRVNRKRLVGQIALEEGELLALRLPDRAIWLLAVAEERLAAAGDLHGAFVAGLRAAIAEIHAERGEGARKRRAAIVERYEAVRRLDPDLPAIERLLEDRGAGSLAEPRDFWRAWVIRLAAYLAWCDGRPADGKVAGATLGLDPELNLTPAAREPAATAARRDRGALAGAAPVDRLDLSIALHHGGRDPEFEALMEPSPPSLMARGVKRLAHWVGGRPPGKVFPLNEEDEDPRQPSPLARELGTWAENPRSIQLAVTSDLAPVDWEWRLARHLVVDRGWESDRIPRIWRAQPANLFSPPPERWSRHMVAVSSPHWRPLVASSADAAARLKVSAQRPRGEEERRGDAAAAIAIGSPAVTRAGWRLRLDDDELSERLSDPSEPRTQDLVSPDLLAREASVAVVFGRPTGLRLTADRRSAEGLRGFANETFLAGAHAAIVVPALPLSRAAEAIALVTAEISAWVSPPDIGRLLKLVDGLRLVASGARGEDRPEGDGGTAKDRLRDNELALGVCLFAPR